ncbi:tyrosine-type recombinase/integrase [Microvirga aerophila]|uniref:Integrase n=1 Tax=Microvirga aerophila TaxID=670291 RepID=A0A512C1V8_9HYPH|nr:site-specific integrase [Microvirga aerophila]GEO18205.1 integrase [Microvirga aerophila]
MAIVNLTNAFLRSIKPPLEGRAEYWDELTPGLCLRVTTSGKATWSFRYRPKGGAGFQRITLGSLIDLPLAEARDRARRHRTTIADGGDPQRHRKANREAAKNILTFDALAERYLQEYAKPRKASWKNDVGYLKRPRAKLGNKPAAAVTRRDVIDLLDGIKVDAPVSANRTQTVLVTMFNWAVEGELLEASPISGLKKRAQEQAKDRTLSDDEIRVLWHTLTTTTDVSHDVAQALRFLLLVGQRPGEVAGAAQAELIALDRPKEARWEIPAARMKGRKAHVVPLGSQAVAILQDVLKQRKIDGDGISVFASKFASRSTLARHSLSQGLKRVIDRLQAEDNDRAHAQSLKDHPPTPHDLRRTVGTGMARLGIPREDRKAVLAHVEGDVHGIHYDRYERLREKRIALGAWERHLSSVIDMREDDRGVVPIRRRSV